MFDSVPRTNFANDQGFWVSQMLGRLAETQTPDRLAKGALRHDELARKLDAMSQATTVSPHPQCQPDFRMSDGRLASHRVGEKLNPTCRAHA